MTKYEYHQNQIDRITGEQLEIYKKSKDSKSQYCWKLLDNVKRNIKNKQLALTVEDGKKKASLFYRIFN